MHLVDRIILNLGFPDFCSISSPEEIPDGDTVGRFRNLLIKAGVQEMLFAQVITLLRSKDLILKKGTIVDSTIISAPQLAKDLSPVLDGDSPCLMRDKWPSSQPQMLFCLYLEHISRYFQLDVQYVFDTLF